ncbi:acyl-CoA carboxylase subunit epsilon [Gordonia sp. CPCC 206044]|uniref:acyl-CoA carboxylase subunit epsilon n=1 Tax=Gordonia sp. CPCC 206044 TaxID=3140793 RepID=UPI003AF3B18F
MSEAKDAVAVSEAQTTGAAPFLRVVRGAPTDEEVAALVAVVAAAAADGSGGAPTDTEPRNEWGRPEDRLRPVWGGPSSFTNLGW